MSRIGWYKSRIRIANVSTAYPKTRQQTMRSHASNIEANPAFQILKRSVEIVAKENHGSLTNFVVDQYGSKKKCRLAVKTAKFKRGVGISIDSKTGKVNFLYDSYGGYDETAKRITEQVTQNYVAISLIRVMKSMGYNVVEQKSKSPSSVILEGQL